MRTSRAEPNRSTIIFLEDHHGDAALLTDALHVQGAEVDVAILDIERAFHYFSIKAPGPDGPPPVCLVLDWHVESDGGMELLEFVRGLADCDSMPIRVLAAEMDRQSVAQALVVPRDSVLIRPIDWPGFMDLGTHLAAILGAKYGRSASPSLDDRHAFPRQS